MHRETNGIFNLPFLNISRHLVLCFFDELTSSSSQGSTSNSCLLDAGVLCVIAIAVLTPDELDEELWPVGMTVVFV